VIQRYSYVHENESEKCPGERFVQSLTEVLQCLQLNAGRQKLKTKQIRSMTTGERYHQS